MKKSIDNFKRQHDYLICIDSDGCAIDGMTLKHERAFGPALFTVFDWGDHQAEIQQEWERVNLYSRHRGINRFLGFGEALKQAASLGYEVPGLEAYLDWLESKPKLAVSSVEEAFEKTKESIFSQAFAWSHEVNRIVEAIPDEEIVPFAHVEEALQKMTPFADIAIVSSANRDAVEREWERDGLLPYISALCAQDVGSKAQSIARLLKLGDYDPTKVLKIGDALGDLEAARTNHVHFYPIIPGQEEASWSRLIDQGLSAFERGDFDDLEAQEIETFKQVLA